MNEVLTPDGWGRVLRTQSSRGRTSYLVEGAGFSGWYDGLQVQADFADDVEDVVPNDDNNTALPYPSAPQGPGWDGTTSTIPPDIDPHIEMGHASDSLTGDSTSESPVGADLDSDFEPHSRLAGARAHRVHFANMSDPILDVEDLPAESPTGLDNSPINPDGVSTDDLFEGGGREHFASATYDHLVIEDDLSFLRFAADDDDDSDDKKKKDHHQQDNYGPFNTDRDDDDDDGDDDSDDDDDSDSDGDSGDGGDSGGSSGGGDGGGGGGHTAAFRAALTTTADLHFLANLCVCAEKLPLHSKSEHRELLAEGALKREADGNTNGVEPQSFDADKLRERYQQDNFNYQESNLANLVDDPSDDADSADLYNKLAFVKHAEESGYEKYIGSNGDGTYHLIASGGGKLPKGKQYGHYDSHEDALHAVEAIIARNHSKASKTAAPAQPPQPTQIESQIEQLMQFWAVDNNGWWHWTGSQSDLALLNQMQQQMMAVGMPQGQPGAMQAQSAAAALAPLLEAGGAEAAVGGEAAAGAEGAEGAAGSKMPSMPGGGGGQGVAGAVSGFANALGGLLGGDGTAHHLNMEQSKYAAAALGEALEGEVLSPGESGYEPGSDDAGGEFSSSNTGDTANSAGSDNAAALLGAANGWMQNRKPKQEESLTHKVPFAVRNPGEGTGFHMEANTPKPWVEYLQVVASDKLVALAAWRDVVQKSKRLRAEGAVDVEAFRPDVITAYVQGDHGRYYTTVQRLGSVAPGVGRQLTSTQVSGWSCECEWGHWAWLRKRSFVGRMCSHAYALFSEMRSLDAKARRPDKGKPGRFASVAKTAWTRDGEQFVWVTQDSAAPTASIAKTASGWNAQVWSDGTSEDSLDLGDFQHSKYAMRAVARIVNAHFKFAAEGDVEMAGDDNVDDYEPEPLPGEGGDDNVYDEGPGPGIQESKTSAFTAFAEASTGDDDEGPEEEDSGIEEEEPDDDESLDEEIAEDEGDAGDDGQDDEGDEGEDAQGSMPSDDDDGGHDEPHKRDGDDDDEGTDNPGDESDDEHVEKQSSVAELQAKFGLSHLAGANYSPSAQAGLVGEGEGKTARNHGDLNLTGTHYVAGAANEDPEDTLAFLF